MTGADTEATETAGHAFGAFQEFLISQHDLPILHRHRPRLPPDGRSEDVREAFRAQEVRKFGSASDHGVLVMKPPVDARVAKTLAAQAQLPEEAVAETYHHVAFRIFPPDQEPGIEGRGEAARHEHRQQQVHLHVEPAFAGPEQP